MDASLAYSHKFALGSLRERGVGDGHLLGIVLLVGVGLNSSGDSDKASFWEVGLNNSELVLLGRA